jgi:regulator of sigma E protease
MFTTIIVFIVILAILVLAHEIGHFISARKLGVAVEEFGFGFPPRLWSKKSGETTYSINWIPIGGFVRLKGEGGEDKSPGSFAAQPAWKRAVILVAGVTMNIALTFVLFSFGFGIGFPTVVTDEQIPQARDVKIQIISLAPDSPATQAGLEVGDSILSLDGKNVTTLTELQKYIGTKAGVSIAVTYERDKKTFTKDIAPVVLSQVKDRAVLGVSLMQTGTISYSWYQAIWQGAVATANLSKEIVLAFGNLFKNLIISHEVPKDISGPVGIAVLTGEVVQLGFIYVLQFAALLSLNLAIINILPFPALDGGRLLFVIIEKIRRKPNNERIEAIVHRIGFSLLMILIILVTYRDVMRFGGSFLGNISKLWGS